MNFSGERLKMIDSFMNHPVFECRRQFEEKIAERQVHGDIQPPLRHGAVTTRRWKSRAWCLMSTHWLLHFYSDE